MFDRNTWKHLSVCKQMSSNLFENAIYKLCVYKHTYIYIWDSLNKFPDFFRLGTFIDSTHMKL